MKQSKYIRCELLVTAKSFSPGVGDVVVIAIDISKSAFDEILEGMSDFGGFQKHVSTGKRIEQTTYSLSIRDTYIKLTQKKTINGYTWGK